MLPQTRHVLFYCDECDLLEPVVKVFNATHPGIKVRTTSALEELTQIAVDKKPEMILIYLQDPKKTYVDVLKHIREHIILSSIEVVIYRALPDEAELTKVFQKIST